MKTLMTILIWLKWLWKKQFYELTITFFCCYFNTTQEYVSDTDTNNEFDCMSRYRKIKQLNYYRTISECLQMFSQTQGFSYVKNTTVWGLKIIELRNFKQELKLTWVIRLLKSNSKLIKLFTSTQEYKFYRVWLFWFILKVG